MTSQDLSRPVPRTREATSEPVGRSSLAVAFITLLVIGTDLFVVSPLLPDIAHQYHVSASVAGVTVTTFSLAYMIGAPIIGTLADRVGRRTVLIGGLTVFGLANALTGLSPWFGMLLAARVLAGLSAAAVTPSVQTLVGLAAPPERRAGWLAVAASGFLISLATGAPTGTAVASLLSWRETFFGIGGVTLVLVVVNLFSWRSVAPGGAPGAGRAPAAGPRSSAVTKARAVSVTGLWAFAVYSLYTYVGTALTDNAHLSTGMVAVALVIYGVGAVAGSLSGGRLADRYGATRVVTGSLVGLSVLEVLLVLAFHAPTAVLLLVLGLFALSAFPCLPAFQSQLMHTFGSEIGSVMAWNSSFMYLGTSLGSAAGGVLLSSAGFSWIAPVAAAVGLFGALVHARWALPVARPA
ncbi:MFS transporter [Streptomyces sp. NBC_00669]|uniref:MFS transporter n=1 Tax=unclassified Streptomyces TaxID=2593676 RepID=UPI002E32EA39|nr:MFS transporter [Streptomyces sp. NBC_00669]